jgi:hypothetical protein
VDISGFFSKYVPHFFFAHSSDHKFWSIFGDVVSYLSSNFTVTKERLLIIFAILSVVKVTILKVYDSVISFTIFLLVSSIILLPPMLFTIARKSRRNKGISPEMKKIFSLKNMSSC